MQEIAFVRECPPRLTMAQPVPPLRLKKRRICHSAYSSISTIHQRKRFSFSLEHMHVPAWARGGGDTWPVDPKLQPSQE